MNKTKTIAPMLALAIAVGACLPACQSICGSGSDVFMVEAKRTVRLSTNMAYGFCLWEMNYRSSDRVTITEEMTDAANRIRDEFPSTLMEVERLMSLYQLSTSRAIRLELDEQLTNLRDGMNLALVFLPPHEAKGFYAKAMK